MTTTNINALTKLRDQLFLLKSLVEESQIIWPKSDQLCKYYSLVSAINYTGIDDITRMMIVEYGKKILEFRKMYQIVVVLLTKFQNIKDMYELKQRIIENNFQIVEKINKSLQSLADIKEYIKILHENFDELSKPTSDKDKQYFNSYCSLLIKMKEDGLFVNVKLLRLYKSFMKYVRKTIVDTFYETDDLTFIFFDITKTYEWPKICLYNISMDKIYQIIRDECITNVKLLKQFWPLIKKYAGSKKISNNPTVAKICDILKQMSHEQKIVDFCSYDMMDELEYFENKQTIDTNVINLTDLFSDWFSKGKATAQLFSTLDNIVDTFEKMNITNSVQLKQFWRENESFKGFTFDVPQNVITVFNEKMPLGLNNIFTDVIRKYNFGNSPDIIKIKKFKDYLTQNAITSFRSIKDCWYNIKQDYDLPFGIKTAFEEEFDL